MSMHSISDSATFQQSLAALPLATCRAGETIPSAASTTGRVPEGVEIAIPVDAGYPYDPLGYCGA
jgi:hypothetical protein